MEEKQYKIQIKKLKNRIIQLEDELKLIYLIDEITDNEIVLEKFLEELKKTIISKINVENVVFIVKRQDQDQKLYTFGGKENVINPDDEEIFFKLNNIFAREKKSCKFPDKNRNITEKIKKISFNIDSLLAFPYYLPPRLSGSFVLVNKKGGKLSRFTKKDEKILEHIVKQSDNAIELALLFQKQKETIKDLEEKNRELNTLYNVSKAVNYQNNLDSVLKLIIDNSINYLDAERGSIMLLNHETDELIVNYIRNAESEKNDEMDNRKYISLKKGEGVAGIAAEKKQSILVRNGYDDKRFKKFDDEITHHKKVKSLICSPILFRDEVLGVINIINPLNRKIFNNEDVKLLESVAGSAAIMLKNFSLNELTLRDPKLGVYNHKQFEINMKKEFERSKRYGNEFVIMMIDIDHFKNINDTYGHQAGDKALVKLVEILLSGVRAQDSVYRFGGEEFSIILPETTLEGGFILAERLRKKVAEISLVYNDEIITIRISIGLSVFSDELNSHTEMTEIADKSLYRAKQSGRNRTIHIQEV